MNTVGIKLQIYCVCVILKLGETLQGLRENLKAAIKILSSVDSSVAVSSGGELFLRFISLTSLEHPVCISAVSPCL